MHVCMCACVCPRGALGDMRQARVDFWICDGTASAMMNSFLGGAWTRSDRLQRGALVIGMGRWVDASVLTLYSLYLCTLCPI